MTKEEKKKKEQQDIIEEMQDELQDIENEQWEIDEEKLIDSQSWKINEKEEDKCKDLLARTMADFDNFKKRVERDREDMIFFLKSDIFKKILPRLDDLERILKNTPEQEKTWALYEWILSVETKFKKDLTNLWVKAFNSIWDTVNHEKHDVMTTIPWKDWIIIDEFEKGYLLDDKVLRHAKVVVWNWLN